MECPICLDPILPQSILGRIHNCLHIYHEQCINEWSRRSNLCPTCRKIFNSIDVVASNLPGMVILTVHVQNRLNENDAINNIPSEFVLTHEAYQEQLAQVSEFDRNDGSTAGVCLICSSAQYTSASMKMASCVGCGGNFHHSCLGRTVEPTWFCPVCDCHQEFPIPLIQSSPSTSSRRTTGQTRSSRRNIVTTTEPDFFMDSEPLVRSTAAINGGVLLRREERARKNLTPEEAQSWDLFEQARNGTNDLITTSTTKPEVLKRKRRPKLNRPAFDFNQAEGTVNLSQTSTVSIAATETYSERTDQSDRSDRSEKTDKISSRVQPTSRISSLMNQIRHNHDGAHLSQPTSDPIVIDLVSGSDQMTLTLDQKRKVQKHVRTLLSCYFDGKDSSKHWIKTESQYIQVNKSISHKVYGALLNQFSEIERLGEFFTQHDEKLHFMVKDRVDEWLQTVGK